MNGISALVNEILENFLSLLSSKRTYLEDSSLQTRKQALTRNRKFCIDVGLPSPQKCEK